MRATTTEDLGGDGVEFGLLGVDFAVEEGEAGGEGGGALFGGGLVGVEDVEDAGFGGLEEDLADGAVERGVVGQVGDFGGSELRPRDFAAALRRLRRDVPLLRLVAPQRLRDLRDLPLLLRRPTLLSWLPLRRVLLLLRILHAGRGVTSLLRRDPALGFDGAHELFELGVVLVDPEALAHGRERLVEETETQLRVREAVKALHKVRRHAQALARVRDRLVVLLLRAPRQRPVRQQQVVLRLHLQRRAVRRLCLPELPRLEQLVPRRPQLVHVRHSPCRLLSLVHSATAILAPATPGRDGPSVRASRVPRAGKSSASLECLLLDDSAHFGESRGRLATDCTFV
mmetsp:Transcript_27210/g.83538  ORF Transcript_27210/g.83538 Transcript_27210/m.83538 type:complete len:342 (-) Transcript_27210:816-1841(-)